jgi:secretion/DNA translocation related TadE-like protein
MTVAVLGVLLATVMALGSALVVAAATTAQHRARSAADLGALAAASALESGQSPGQACDAGEVVVRSNGAGPLACDVTADGSVEVEVGVSWSAAVPSLGGQTARARSRAGPSQEGGAITRSVRDP